MARSTVKRVKDMFAILCAGKHDRRMQIDPWTQDGKQWIFSGVPLPSLGATAASGGPIRKLRPFIISPYNHYYRYTKQKMYTCLIWEFNACLVFFKYAQIQELLMKNRNVVVRVVLLFSLVSLPISRFVFHVVVIVTFLANIIIDWHVTNGSFMFHRGDADFGINFW